MYSMSSIYAINVYKRALVNHIMDKHYITCVRLATRVEALSLMTSNDLYRHTRAQERHTVKNINEIKKFVTKIPQMNILRTSTANRLYTRCVCVSV